jgi:formylglycine-generating enzyme required for sulfatase activity
VQVLSIQGILSRASSLYRRTPGEVALNIFKTDINTILRLFYIHRFGEHNMKIIFVCMLCSIFASLSLSQEMVQVAAGTFQMGSTDSLDNGAIPLHSVTLGSFNIDEYEVTYEKWTEVYNWGLTHGYADLAAGTNGFNHSGTNNPITGVNWYDIAKWCNARSEKNGFPPVYYTSSALDTVYRTGDIDLAANAVKWNVNGYRLPTEAEWEFAARGGNNSLGYIYSGSNTKGDVAWYAANSDFGTHTVGTKAANELGIYDMSGNIYEWCFDWYGAYSSESQTDPKGPAIGSNRVMRGGSFYYDDGSQRVTYRGDDFVMSNYRSYGTYGFRCVQTIGTGVGIGKVSRDIPLDFSLSQNYPDPFNPSTTIRYALPARSLVRIVIYNLLGQVVKVLTDAEQQPGYQSVVWNANAASGMYFYRIEASSIDNPNNRFVETKKMLLLK